MLSFAHAARYPPPARIVRLLRSTRARQFRSPDESRVIDVSFNALSAMRSVLLYLAA